MGSTEGTKSRVNVGKTKVICNVAYVTVLRSNVLPCDVCRWGVGGHSILCTMCGNSVQMKCSDVMGSVSNLNDYL